MSDVAHWIRYAPHEFARARDYQFDAFGLAVGAAVRDAFVIQAGRAVQAVASGGEPVWQFLPATDAFFVLSRGAMQHAGGNSAATVWGLLLPREYLGDDRFALHALTASFPSDAYAAPPAPAPLGGAQPQAGEDVRLAGNAFLRDGIVRVPASTVEETLRLFCQVIEALPPADRLAVSFATAPLGMRKLEPAGKGGEAPPSAPGARDYDRLALWKILEPLLSAERAAVSLRGDARRWLYRALARTEPTDAYAHLADAILQRVAEPSQAPMLQLLREALEALLARIPPDRAGRLLETLHGRGYFGARYHVGPLWPTRIAIDRRVLGSLGPPLLAHLFRADAQPLLFGAIRGDALKLAAFTHAATRARPRGEDRLAFLRACSARFRSQVAASGSFADRAALLSLYRYALPTDVGPTERTP